MNSNCLISIVIPSFNQGEFLRETIESVISQQDPDLELIIMDGGSTDNSVEIIKEYAAHLKYWQSQPDNGQSAAINAGFKIASGRFKAWLNSDDILLPGAIASLRREIARHPYCRWFAGSTLWIDRDSRVIKARRQAQTGKWFYSEKLSPASPSSFLRDDLLAENGMLNEDLHYLMDTELWYRLIRNGCTLRRIPGYTWALRLHPNAKMSGHNFAQSPFKNPDHPSRIQKQKERDHVRTLATGNTVRDLINFYLNKIFDRSIFSFLTDRKFTGQKLADLTPKLHHLNHTTPAGKKPELLFVSTYPAPYMDQLLHNLSASFQLKAVFQAERSGARPWKDDYIPYPCDYFKYLGLFKGIRLIISRPICILGGTNFFNVKIGLLLRLVSGKKTLLMSDYPVNSHPGLLKKMLKKMLFLSPALHLAATGRATVNYFRDFYNLGPEKVLLFAYEFNRPKSAVAPASVSDGPLRLLVANSFYPRKGYHILEKSLRLLKHRNLLSDFEITVCGDGPEFRNFQTVCQKEFPGVKLTGAVPYDQYIELLESTDIFLHASLFEPFGIPPLDALARGKAVIVSDQVMSCCGMIKNNVNGFSYPANSPESLAHILSDIAGNRKQLPAIGEAGRESVFSAYPAELYCRAIERASQHRRKLFKQYCVDRIFYLKEAIFHPGTIRAFDEAMFCEKLTYEELQLFQQEKLKKLLTYAIKHVPFYRELAKQENWDLANIDITGFPVITKEVLRRRSDEFISDQFRKQQLKQLYTSGSTGEPFGFWRHHPESSYSNACFWRSLLRFGIRPGMKRVAIRGFAQTGKKPWKRAIEEFFQIHFNHQLPIDARNMGRSRETLAETVKKIIRFQPRYIHGYVSSLCELVDYLSQQGISHKQLCPRLSAIVCESEKLRPDQKQKLSDYFRLPVIEDYGCIESGMIAQMTPDGKLTIHDDHIYLETDRENNLLLTNLDAFAFPFIRFANGDQAEFAQESNDLLPYRQLKQIIGRSVDRILLPDGKYLHASNLILLMTGSCRQIKAYQFYQPDRESLILRIIPNECTKEQAFKTLYEKISNSIHPLQLQIQFVEEIPKTASGKLRFIYSECK